MPACIEVIIMHTQVHFHNDVISLDGRSSDCVLEFCCTMSAYHIHRLAVAVLLVWTAYPVNTAGK